MFEGLVQQLLQGYLGRYIKDFNREQLKITIWNEEVLFENVGLILEAFDYLQLPFALEEGRVGRLSIKIPWKKLGRDPIIILLDDVFFCAGKRDDDEWSANAVESRELAAKNAKLAAAELGKLERRVSDNQSGVSFFSYIAGSILDNIQVSIKNFHILYREMRPDSMQMLFGLNFKSVTVTRSSIKKTRSDQVSKSVEIHGLGIYCTTYKGSLDLVSVDAARDSRLNMPTELPEDQYVLLPFDASLLVLKSGNVESDAPQYSVIAELTKMVMSVDARQLRSMLVFSDFICSCQLREKYGRYRPLGKMLSTKTRGWEKAWWHYAQEAVLSDVRKKLKKSSWRYFAQRLDSRRKYVKLYKIKLNFLQKQQPVDAPVLEELQHMEKDFDIDDILEFRSIAEQQLEDLASSFTNSDICAEGHGVTAERSRHDDISTSRSRGWLNWLSRGMLGAGGTDDSNQFSGVVSEEIIKDICEATMFQPMHALHGDVAAGGVNFLATVKVSIDQVLLSMRSLKLDQGVTRLKFHGFMAEFKVWDDCATIVTTIESTRILNSSEKVATVEKERVTPDNSELDIRQPSISLQVDISSKAQEAELLVKITLQPIVVYLNSEFFTNLVEFYGVLESVELQRERVLRSLDGISDVMSRLSSKAEYLLSGRRRVRWDISSANISFHVPWSTLDMPNCSLVITALACRISSCFDNKFITNELFSKPAVLGSILKTDVSVGVNGFLLEGLYDNYEVNLNDFEILLVMPSHPRGIPVVEKLCFSVTLARCIIPQEIALKELQAQITIRSLVVHVAPSIIGSIMRVFEDMHLLICECKKRVAMAGGSLDAISGVESMMLCFSVSANIELLKLEINLEDCIDDSSLFLLSLGQIYTWYAQTGVREGLLSLRTINIINCQMGCEDDILILCSSRAGNDKLQDAISGEQIEKVDTCLCLRYKVHELQDTSELKCYACLNDTDFHCYPKVVGLLVRFCDKLPEFHAYGDEELSACSVESRSSAGVHSLGLQKFGFSNFHENGSSEYPSIPVNQFPFIRMQSSGCLVNLEKPDIPSIPEDMNSFNSKDKHAWKSPVILNAAHRNSERSEIPFLGHSSVDILFAMELKLMNVELSLHDASSIVGNAAIPDCEIILSSHENCFELMCSSKGLTLFSPYNQTLLWAPLLPHRYPVLNARMKKGPSLSSGYLLELCLSIQNVSCFLPPEYLAILIGYFSLPDWGMMKDKNEVDLELTGAGNEGRFLYKLEILESALMSPVENNKECFLKLEIPELFSTFIENDTSITALDGIIPECLVPVDKVAARVNSLNIFGHNSSLSLLLCNSSIHGSSPPNQMVAMESCTLAEALSVDLWIRIPHESWSLFSTDPPQSCIMARIVGCDLIVEDSYFSAGLQGLSVVIDQYSSVGREAKYFTDDVEKFLELKTALKDSSGLPAELSSDTLAEVRCCTGLICINLNGLNEESKIQEMVARFETAFEVTASLRNDTVLALDANFSSVSLSSLRIPVTLASCCADSSIPSALDICMSTVEEGQIKLLVKLPSLSLWLYLSEWLTIVDLLDSYFRLPPVVLSSSAADPGVRLPEQTDSEDFVPSQSISTCNDPEKSVSHGVFLSLRLENLGVSCHIPVLNDEASLTEAGASLHQEGTTDSLPGGLKECKVITVSLQGGTSDLSVDGINVKFRYTFGRITGSVGIRETAISRSWPFFMMFQVSGDLEVFDYKSAPLCVKADISCEAFDVWLSHPVLYFWNGIESDSFKGSNRAYDAGLVEISFQLSRASILLTDGRWSCNGPLAELILRNLNMQTIITEKGLQISANSSLNINYNNIQKVSWEPFVEPWTFEVIVTRRHDEIGLLDSGITTDIQLKSTTGLNINFTEPVVEVLHRAFEMVKDARGLMQLNMESQGLQHYQHFESLCSRRYAPYVIHNMTSLPLIFRVCQGLVIGDNVDISTSKQETIVAAGSSVPVYVDEEVDEEVFCYRPTHSSEGLNKKQPNSSAHQFMTIQFEGTPDPSEPISMDLVGLTYFEVDFSMGNSKADESGRLLVPVVFDVSMLRYTKLIQLYSTVILTNFTATPLELRFDIPFGISPKIVDPIHPGQEFPLPLHLAEAGRISWRPLGNNYLWSESHNLSDILSHEGRSGFLRSLVCYSSNPSSDPFRCCLSVQDIRLSFAGRPKDVLVHTFKGTLKQFMNTGNQFCGNDQSKSRFIHRVILNTPLTLKNYLPEAISVTIENGGISRFIKLREVETPCYNIDPSHDLRMAFNVIGFRPSSVSFPRSETFGSMAKPCGNVLSLTETMSFDSESANGTICVTVEKTMDVLSGARDLCISVPFLLYNCTGFSLDIINSMHELDGSYVTVPSCYHSSEQLLLQKDGLGFLSSENFSPRHSSRFVNQSGTSSQGKLTLASENIGRDSGKFLSQSTSGFPVHLHPLLEHQEHDAEVASLSSVNNSQELESIIISGHDSSNMVGSQAANAKPFMYSPDANVPATEVMVRLRRSCPECTMKSSSWSSAFFLVAPSASTTVLIPQQSTLSAAVVSVTSSLLDIPISGRTRAVCFQPKYVISNACSKDLCYKQKGSDYVFQLGIGKHSHLIWPDIARELLVSVRFNAPGWQWSGCFSPDHPGDQQVKMRNYLSGALNMIRVEVQSADDVSEDEKILRSTFSNSGTNFILLSDDDTGFMPYRIDNFSNETLRVYQQKCETLETVIHPYTSCPYSWDEPSYPHRLVVEIPGERVLGSFAMDDVQHYAPVNLPSSSEKRERVLLSSVHAEGAMKVLSVIDSGYHDLGDLRDANFTAYAEKRKQNDRGESLADFKERISLTISSVGISLVNSYPQEILFACAKDMKIDLSQTVEHQKFFLKITALQIDNQLRSTQYPVTLSFDQEQRGKHLSYLGYEDKDMKSKNGSLKEFVPVSTSEPVVWITGAKWRNKDMRLVSFECISIRIADFHLELDQELLLSLVDFYQAAALTIQTMDAAYMHPEVNECEPSMDALTVSSRYALQDLKFLQVSQKLPISKVDGSTLRYCRNNPSLPEVVPVGAPWQKIYLFARRHNKIYVESFCIAPIKITLSFSSSPWMFKSGVLASGDSLFQRGLMALADVEGATVHLRKLSITHHIASWESIKDIVGKHYTKQFLHEMFKIFGSAGVIGNPMGFARRVGYGIKDFLSVPAKGILESPAGLVTGMAHGTSSLVSNTLYAVSDAATQFSKAAHKGILAFTYDHQDVAQSEKQQVAALTHSKGVINELLEGLTGLLQSPIEGAEKHGLPGVLSGFALGVTGLVARPAASVLEATGRTAQSIRNRSKLHRMGHHPFRTRLPRPLSREAALKPYSWEEAIGNAVLTEAEGGSFEGETLIMCKSLKQPGNFVVLTEKLIIIVNCPSLVDLAKPEFQGIVVDPEWIVEVKIGLESVIHVDADECAVHIVGSNSQTPMKRNQRQQHQRPGGGRAQRWNGFPAPLPLFQTTLELLSKEEADYFFMVLMSMIEVGKERGWGNVHLLHRSTLK